MNALLRSTESEMPCNIDAEQALLGAILVNNEAIKSLPAQFHSEHFSEKFHTAIFDAIKVQIGQGRIANPITVKSAVAEIKIGDKTTSQYLALLASEAVTILNVRDYASIITAAYVARESILDAQAISEISRDRWADPNLLDDIINLAVKIKLRTESSRPRRRIRPGDAYQAYFEQSMANGAVGVPIALSGLRKAMSEDIFEASNFYGLLGASGEGKTSATTEIMLRAVKEGHPVLFQSYDLTPEQVVRQMISQVHGISVKQQSSNSLSDSEREKCYELSESLNRRPFEVINCQRENASQLIGYARQFVNENRNGKTPFIVTDHIRKIRPEDHRASADVQSGQITAEFKAFAKEQNCACLMLNQRNGQGSGRLNPRPTAKDLYGGEGARQDYDTIAYIYRPQHWRKDMLATASDQREIDKINRVFAEFGEDVENVAEFGAIKVRFGSSDQREVMKFDAKYTRYRDIYREEQSRMAV